MHEEYIIKNILSRLNLQNTFLHKISLICSEQSLVERLSKDIVNGVRAKDVVACSVSRLRNNALMDTFKIDVSKITTEQAVQKIIDYIRG